MSNSLMLQEGHRRTWAGIYVPPWMYPLVSEYDFECERERMKHCIVQYFRHVGFFFAHLDLDNEKATMQVNKSFQLLQLFGPRNRDSSSFMRDAVEKWTVKAQSDRYCAGLNKVGV